MNARLCRLAILVGLVTIEMALGADNRIDVSKIVDKAAAESLLEEPVNAPSPRNVDGSDGYYSKCNYYSTSGRKRLVLRVYQAAEGFDPQKELEAVAETAGAMRAVSGIGDKARITSGVQAGLPSRVVMLYVVKGRSLVTIGISGIDDENTAADKIKSTAQKIVSQL